MQIHVQRKGNAAVLAIHGPLSAGGDEMLRDRVSALLDAGTRVFVLDLRRVPYIDSVGLGETVACTKRVCDRNGSLSLVVTSGKVREVLRITGLDRAYRIFEDEQAALAEPS